MATRAPRRQPSESSEQRDLVKHLRRSRLLYCAVPNGANVSVRERTKLVAEGLVKGVPDMLVFSSPTTPPTTAVPLTPLEVAVAEQLAALLAELPDPWKVLKAIGFAKGAAVELKRQDGGSGPSPHQQRWINRLSALGWWAGVAPGSRAARSLLASWGYPTT
jgi:hypothetical protein